jgi:hypothetical protein
MCPLDVEWAHLFVGDDLADGGDTFFDAGDFFGPTASRGIRVGYSRGVLAFGFRKMVDQDVESVL